MLSLLLGKTRRASTTPGPADDFWYGPVSQPTASKEVVTEDTALNYSAVWAATRLLSSSVGMLPLDMFRRLPNNGREYAADDPRERLVHDRPCLAMSAMMWRAQGAIQQINAGNCYFEIERVSQTRMPANLWPIHHSRVRIYENDGMPSYGIRTDSIEVLFEPKDILHVPSMVSDDGICGKGVITAARESIGFGLATEKYGAAWFGKGGVPRLALTHPGQLKDTARENLRREWSTAYGGPDASRVAVLQEGMGLQSISVSNEDSQFLATREHNVNEIARWYGIPPHMIGDLRRATFANVEHQGIEFVTYALMPWLKLWEQELWAKLLTEDEQDEYFFEFNVDALKRGDSAARSNYYRTMVTLGAMSRNEVRALENMNPVDGGDTFLVQGAMFAVDEDGMPQQPGTSDASVAEGGDNAVAAGNDNGVADTEDDVPEPTDATEMRAHVVASLRHSLSRMAYKESEAARRASTKPSEFLRWIESFYAKHELDILAETGNAMRAIGVVPDGVVSQWCDASRSELLSASDVTPDVFQAAVSKAVSQWSTTRVAAFLKSQGF